jgi:hypothetical protein
MISMNKFLLIFSVLLTSCIMAYGQLSADLRDKCPLNSGSNARFIKDFRVELGKSGDNKTGLRYKASIPLWKNKKYRFSLCDEQGSTGKLILTIKDNTNKVILTSYDGNGNTYPFVDFICNKSSIYNLYYDFYDGNQGAGVGVVSLLR